MYRVILIDDEPWALYALEHGIGWKEKGYSVVATAENGEDGLKLIEEWKPDVVFTDVRMDDMSGLELLREARERGIGAEFVIVSAYGEFSYAQEAIRYHSFDYIVKPVETAEGNRLLERLAAHLERKRYMAEQVRLVVPAGERKGYEVLNQNFMELLHYVEGHFREELTLERLSERYFLNASYVCVLFKRATGETFLGYLNTLRMREAHRLLLTTDDSLAKVAETAGYRDYYYFSRAFKKRFGISPRQCRLEGRRTDGEEI